VTWRWRKEKKDERLKLLTILTLNYIEITKITHKYIVKKIHFFVSLFYFYFSMACWNDQYYSIFHFSLHLLFFLFIYLYFVSKSQYIQLLILILFSSFPSPPCWGGGYLSVQYTPGLQPSPPPPSLSVTGLHNTLSQWFKDTQSTKVYKTVF